MRGWQRLKIPGHQSFIICGVMKEDGKGEKGDRKKRKRTVCQCDGWLAANTKNNLVNLIKVNLINKWITCG